MPKIKVENLSLKIKNKVILDKISITLEEYEDLVIIGESGSGKSTFSKIFLGVKPIKSKISGIVEIDNKNILNLSEKDWKKYRGNKYVYVYQNSMAVFNQYQNIKSHIIELYKSHKKIEKDKIIEKILRVMEKLNFKNPEVILEKYPFQLSGGMLQRIMLIMILGLEPELLILDEPTSSLDKENIEKIIEILQEYKKENNKLIVITHDYDFAKKIGGKLLVLKDGKVYKKGKMEKIFSNNVIEDVYMSQLLEEKKLIKYREDIKK